MCLELLQEKETASSEDYNHLAFIYSRHNEKEKVISSYCKALEKSRSNKRAKKALDYIRRQSGEINFSEDEYFEKILKKEPFFVPVSLSIKIFIMAAVIFFAAVLSYNGINIFLKNSEMLKSKTELDKIILPDYNPNLLEKPKEDKVDFSYSEKEIKEIFEKIKSNILENKAVSAQILINQIKLSNASPNVKVKMNLLEDYIIEPDYAFFKNVLSFNDFTKNKNLYDKVYILWHGRVVNQAITKESIKFFLVIGDEKAGIVEGMAPVVFEKAVVLKNNDMVDIFGKIRLDERSSEKADAFYIEGKFAIKEKK
jgi:hypothetical protein